ncbi:hypothetical protein BJV78DRAFT_1282060 [Lactifluus subvellereus]|nr:hypothetical protein BJV78DRAFT_1282060 [Lactifluus subvellereus]
MSSIKGIGWICSLTEATAFEFCGGAEWPLRCADKSNAGSAVFAELESLPDSDDGTIKKERAEILGRLRGLKLAALKKYREKQKETPQQQTAKTAKTKDVGHYRIPFFRIRHLMPVRQRLSESLFTIAAIRSKAGRVVLKDLIELYRSEFEVEARPGLELKNCHCAVPKRPLVHEPGRLEAPLREPPDEPRYSTPSYATPILSLRLRFLDKASWQFHIEKEHLAESTGCKVPTCLHPKCSYPFEKPEDRDFHLHDVHCWEPRKLKAGVKRRRSCQEKEEESEEESEEKPPKRRRDTIRRIARPGTFVFVEQNSLFGSSPSPSSTSTTSSMDVDAPELSDGISSSSSASSTLSTPTHSPEPTLNAHAIDHSSLDPEFVAALRQMELVPEEDAQPGTQEFEAQAV